MKNLIRCPQATGRAPGLLFALCAIFVSATSAVGQKPTDGTTEAAAPVARGAVSPVIAALDANADGEISAEEIANAAAALKKLDKNNDGKISGDELRPPMAAAATEDADFVTRFFDKFDKNKDGKVNEDELSQQNSPLLKRGDANKDGALDKAELENLTKTLGAETSNAPEAPAAETQPDAPASP